MLSATRLAPAACRTPPARAPALLRLFSIPTAANSSHPKAGGQLQSPESSTPLDPRSYFVHRTPSQQLPVYQKLKKGGTLQLTRIRKVTGKVEDLKKDLQQALGIPDHKISIHPLNRHIVIKGWVRKDVAAFLEKQRF